MEFEDQFETKDQVMMNRIRIRKYLRELLLNSRRIEEIIAMNEIKTQEEADAEAQA